MSLRRPKPPIKGGSAPEEVVVCICKNLTFFLGLRKYNSSYREKFVHGNFVSREHSMFTL
jgi:hypothetical protein